MLTYNQRVAHEFGKLIDEKIVAVSRDVVAGMLCDMSAYKALTGEIRGLREARDILGEAISICEGKQQ